MGTYAFYALGVTALYIVYMGVTIAFDLHGKKAKKQDDAEEFVSEDTDDEVSAVVDETEEGYMVRQEYADEPEKDSEDAASGGMANCVPLTPQTITLSRLLRQSDDDEYDEDVEQPVDVSVDDDDVLEEESQDSQKDFEDKKVALQQAMTECKSSYQDEYVSNEMEMMMAQPIDQESKVGREVAQSLMH